MTWWPYSIIVLISSFFAISRHFRKVSIVGVCWLASNLQDISQTQISPVSWKYWRILQLHPSRKSYLSKTSSLRNQPPQKWTMTASWSFSRMPICLSWEIVRRLISSTQEIQARVYYFSSSVIRITPRILNVWLECQYFQFFSFIFVQFNSSE